MAKPSEQNFTPANPKQPFSPFAPEEEVLQSVAIKEEQKGLGKSYVELYGKKKKYVAERAREIWNSSGGSIDPNTAKSQASKEFDDEYLLPLTSQYTDTYGEAAFNLVGPFEPEPAPIIQLPAPKDEFGVAEEPSFMTAFRPQTYYSPFAAEALRPFEEKKQAKGQEIDFNEVQKSLEEEEKLDKATASLQAAAIQAAYNEVRRINKDLTPEDAYTKTIEELQGLGTTMAGEGRTISGAGQTGPADPLYRTFVIQKQAGKVPDLSRPQLAYFDYVYKDSQRKIREEETAKIKKQGVPYVRLSDGSEYPADVWDAMKMGGMPSDIAALAGSEERFTKEGGKLDKAELEGRVNRRVIDEAPDIWWADPAKKPAVLNNPEAFNKKGIFSTDTPFGGTIETPAGWLFRSAMTIPNLTAGTFYENVVVPMVDKTTGAGLAEKRAASREEKTPLYKESPVLLSVAEGRGFTLEQREAGKLLDMSENGQLAMTAIGFAADLLDPTLGFMAGVAKTGKTVPQAYKLSKALYSEASLADAFKLGARSGATEFLNDFNIVSLIAKPVMGKDKVARLAVGDIRTHMGADLTASLIARDTVKEGIAAGKTGRQILFDIAPYADTTYGKSFSQNLRNAGDDVARAFDDTEGLVKAAREIKGTSPKQYLTLLDEHDAAMDSIDNIARGNISAEATKGIRTKDLARNLGAMAKRDEGVAQLFRNVDNTSKAGVPKIYQYVEALGPNALKTLKNQFAYDRALTSVYRASQTFGKAGKALMAGGSLDNMVAITKNTWADKDSAAKILDRVKSSEVGATAKAIIDANVPVEIGDITTNLSTRSTITGTTGTTAGTPTLAAPTVAPYYNLNKVGDATIKNDLIDRLSRIIEEQVTYGKVKSNAAARMRTNLSSGILTTRDFRTLIDGATDLTAEAMFAGKEARGARARDLARTSSAQQLTALEPLEFRSFGRGGLKQFTVDNFGKANETASRGRVSVQQRRIMNEVQQRASTMDTELRRRMGALVGDEAAAKNIG